MPDNDSFKTQLEKSAAEHLRQFGSLQTIRNKADQLLSLIGKGKTFKNYTDHGIGHADRMLSIMEELLIPPDVLQTILKSEEECTLLVMGTYLHDIGMFVDPQEEEAVLKGEQSWWPGVEDISFNVFREQFIADHRNDILAAGVNPDEVPDEYVQGVILEEFFRQYHARRAQKFILANQLRLPDGKFETIIDLDVGGATISYLASLCRSHGEPLFDFAGKQLPSRQPDLQYLACLLRLADLLDLSRHRAPARTMVYLQNPSNTALREWWRHIASERPELLDKDTVLVKAVFAESTNRHAPEHYRALIDYLQYMEEELRDARALLQRRETDGGDRRLAVRKVYLPNPEEADLDPYIRCEDFSARTYRFELAADRIICLLMGENIYEEPAFAIREVLPNAIDATRRHFDSDTPEHPMAKIEVEYETSPKHFPPYDQQNPPGERGDDLYYEHHRLVIRDFGVGMTRDVIDQFFCQIGRSYYWENPSFDREKANFTPISRFGVGILSLFMLCDRAQITTQHRSDGAPVIQLDIRQTHRHFVTRILERENIYPEHSDWPHGTELRLWLKPQFLVEDKDKDSCPVKHSVLQIERVVRYWCRQIGFPVSVSVDGGAPVEVLDRDEPVGQSVDLGGGKKYQIVHIPIDHPEQGISGSLFYRAVSDASGLPVPGSPERPGPGPQAWKEQPSLPSLPKPAILNGGVLCAEADPDWLGRHPPYAYDFSWAVNVTKPGEITPLLNRTEVKRDVHWKQINDTALGDLLRKADELAQAASLNDSTCRVLALHQVLGKLVDWNKVIAYKQYRDFAEGRRILPFLLNGEVVTRTISEAFEEGKPVVVIEHRELYRFSEHKVLCPFWLGDYPRRQLIDAGIQYLPQFLCFKISTKSCADQLVAYEPGIGSRCVRSYLLSQAHIPTGCVGMFPDALWAFEWSLKRRPEDESALEAALNVALPVFRRWNPCPETDLWQPIPCPDYAGGRSYHFALNTSYPQIRALSDVLAENDDEVTKRAASDIGRAVVEASVEESGSEKANKLMADLYDHLAEGKRKLAISKEDFCFTESEIPKVNPDEWIKNLANEYCEEYTAWMDSNGGKLPKYYAQYFGIEEQEGNEPAT